MASRYRCPDNCRRRASLQASRPVSGHVCSALSFALISKRRICLRRPFTLRLESLLVFLLEATTISCGRHSDQFNHAMPKMRKP